MVHWSIFGIIGGAVLVTLGLLMGFAVFPPVVNTKVKEVSILLLFVMLSRFQFPYNCR